MQKAQHWKYLHSFLIEMWQIVSCPIYWWIRDKLWAVMFADGFFLRIPASWLREGGTAKGGRSNQKSLRRYDSFNHASNTPMNVDGAKM